MSLHLHWTTAVGSVLSVRHLLLAFADIPLLIPFGLGGVSLGNT